MSQKQTEIALGAAFVSGINQTLQSVQRGSHRTSKGTLNKNVSVRTVGCQLRPNDLDQLNTAAKIALNEALDVVSNHNAAKKNQMVNDLWPGIDTIEVSFTMTPERNFVWSLDLD